MSSLAIPNLFSVDGQVVLVTGGGTGLGKMIATAFAENGAKVYITGRRADVLKLTAESVNEQVKGEGGKGSVVA
jgi:NAD(P)-dependent dehydrogenase (short-subunit alcohol dehydrogenase family)